MWFLLLACFSTKDTPASDSSVPDVTDSGDADTDIDADTDSDSAEPAETGIVYYGWDGDYTGASTALTGTFGMWFYYALTSDYLCVWDAPNNGVEPAADCDDCSIAWSTEWGNGTTISGECTYWGLTDGEHGGDTFGVPWFGVGFAPEYTNTNGTYNDIAMLQFEEGGDWYGVAYAEYDGDALSFRMYSSYTDYY